MGTKLRKRDVGHDDKDLVQLAGYHAYREGIHFENRGVFR